MRIPSHSLLCASLMGTVGLMISSCAGTVTPPESTPVYADDIAPGVDVISVERSSTDKPELDTVSQAKTEEAEEAPEASPPEATPAAPTGKEADDSKDKALKSKDSTKNEAPPAP